MGITNKYNGEHNPDSKIHGANMGHIWGRQDPGGPHVGPINCWEATNSFVTNSIPVMNMCRIILYPQSGMVWGQGPVSSGTIQLRKPWSPNQFWC